MPNPNDKRIAKNAIYLYGRMMLTIFVSLYTSRVVLDVLGVSDYGVYNVVGGIVVILGFLYGTMSGATSRFISYELGTGDPQRLRRTFSAAMTVHVALAALVLLVGETAGLWYINHELVIAPGRMAAANWVYQYSLFASLLTIIQIPYVATIMAHERMGYYARVAIANVLLKLAAILIVKWVAAADNLSTYAAMIFIGAAIVAAMYMVYSRRCFPECRWSLRNDPSIVRAMLKFFGSDIYGTLCFTTRAQGVLVILNRFGGTVLNAAGGLCATVSATVNSFAGSVITAFRPQIIRQYAAGEYDYMLTLMANCARFSLLLLGLLIIPLILGMDTLLDIWLVDPPKYTAVFCRIALIAVLGELLHTILAIGIHATGKIFRFSIISGTLFIAELPLMWLLLRATDNPPVVYTIHLAMIFLIVMVDSQLLHLNFPEFRAARFWQRGIILPMLLIAATFAATLLLDSKLLTPYISIPLLRLVIAALISTLLLSLLTLLFILDRPMRQALWRRLERRVERGERD